ncbi:SMAD/FHA domain-containing protein [Mycena galopus ATCC 62051]|nr:SMAD/FHA domain-containing protein [Mycena galopus ATCC 62051]
MASSGEIPALYLLPLDSSFFPPKRIHLPPGTRVRVGRQLNPKSAPNAGNGVFESRVLSRQHAEVWVEDERMLIRDVKSSNGTFVNGERLSAAFYSLVFVLALLLFASTLCSTLARRRTSRLRVLVVGLLRHARAPGA